MRGWNRTSFKDAVKTKALWLRYCLCLAQVLVVVAYFLPWFDGRWSIDEGPIIWACSVAAIPIPSHILPAFVVIILGLAAALLSLVLIAMTCLLRSNSVRMLSTASLLNSLAIACPLFYPPGWDPSYWPDTWDAVRYASAGWYMALLLGFVVGLLILRMYNGIDRPDRIRYPVEGVPLRLFPALGGVTLLFAAGMILAVDGLFHIWGSGTVYILQSFSSWSSSGLESSPAMILVPIAAISVLTVFVLDRVFDDGRMGVFQLAAHSAFVTAFALSLLWGFATYEQQWSTGDPYGSYTSVVQLHSGWYQCIIGESAILLGILLHRILIWRVTRKYDNARKPDDSGSVQPS
jgi:hypothetical protein